MNTSTANRSFFGISTLPLIAALLFSVVTSFFQIAQAASVNGRNVNVVSVDNGTFRQVSRKSWVEQNKQGQRVFSFKETHRDAWSIYLKDIRRNFRIQLDLYSNVRRNAWNNDPFHDVDKIAGATSKVTGRLVNRIDYTTNGSEVDGSLRQVSKDTWIEDDLDQGYNLFRFKEVFRGLWAVELLDESRGIKLRANLHTLQVSQSTHGGPWVDRHQVAKTFSFVKLDLNLAIYINEEFG